MNKNKIQNTSVKIGGSHKFIEELVMKKYVLVGLVALISISVMASPDNVARVKKCDEYWKPIIADIKETLNGVRSEWESLPFSQREGQKCDSICSMIKKLEWQLHVAEHARMTCYRDGLEESKREYNKLL
jgi:hypothetical protein